jgi:aryl-alcohol dehydrogenase-like predicted oxidoreductase
VAQRIALAWLLHQKAVMSVIIGAKSIAQLDDNLAATDIQLSAEELSALDKAAPSPVNIHNGCSTVSMATGFPLHCVDS